MPRVPIRVVPNAKKDEVVADSGRLTVKTTAPPDKGKANRAVLKLLEKHFGRKVRLVAGEKSREKIIEVV
jgi:hypothetical protein